MDTLNWEDQIYSTHVVRHKNVVLVVKRALPKDTLKRGFKQHWNFKIIWC